MIAKPCSVVIVIGRQLKPPPVNVRQTLYFEIMRVTGHGGGSRNWSKNSIPISFPTQNLKLSSRSYRVAASCHHRGSIKSGHWTTKVCTSTGTWYELDDLKGKPSVTNPPGTLDSSVPHYLLQKIDLLSNWTYSTIIPIIIRFTSILGLLPLTENFGQIR